MTFREASLIGAGSVGLRIVLALVSMVPEPGILHSTVHKCVGLLADIGLLTFFIVLYQKHADASRLLCEKEDVHTRASLIGAGGAGLRVFLSLISFVPEPGILHSTACRILSLLADIGLLTFFTVLCGSQKDAMRLESGKDGTRQRSRGTGWVKAVLVSVGIPLTVQLYLVGLLCLLSILGLGHYDIPQESTGFVAAVFSLGIIFLTLINFIITIIWHRQRFWTLLLRGIAVAIAAHVVGIPLAVQQIFAGLARL
mgnify:FL=1